ncbi:hypothetical protein B0H34DRAFT_784706 [Crassisporium funariophilum]|nr:hypothetical protein B0H34DRAFT_784706 [Crassisporium funariophilum]
MTDLTVLVSPIPLYPDTRDFAFGRRTSRPVSKPIMVTLESEVDEAADKPHSPKVRSPEEMDFLEQPPSLPRRSRTPRIVDSSLLSPPINTWKSRPRHRPTRSQSAPPERRIQPLIILDEKKTILVPDTDSADEDPLGFVPRNPKRSFTSFTSRPINRTGELVRPPPPLLRPTTFWRKTRRSGVTGASYSPASHLIRRSTYIAAGLSFDAPVHDLSALCVESRVGFIVVPSDQSF